MEKVNYIQILKRVKVLCWTFLIATFALKILGFEVFGVNVQNERLIQIVNFVDDTKLIKLIVNIVQNILTLVLLYNYGIKEYIVENKKKIIAFAGIYSCFLSVIYVFDYRYIVIAILSLFPYIFMYYICRNYTTCLNVVILDFVLTFLSANIINADVFNSNSFLLSVVISIDYFMMWTILNISEKEVATWQLCLGGVQDLWKISSVNDLKNVLQNIINQCKIRKVKTRLYILKSVFSKQRLNLKNYLKFDVIDDISESWVSVTIVFSLYLAFAWVFDRTIEAVYLYIAYLSIRGLFPKHFHADYIPKIRKELIKVTCICLSTLTFCFALFSTTLFSFSIFTIVIVAFMVDFVLYAFRDWLDLSKRYDTDFTKYGLSHEKAKFAYDYKVNKMTIKQQMAITGLTEQVVRNYRSDVNRAMREYENRLTKEDK